MKIQDRRPTPDDFGIDGDNWNSAAEEAYYNAMEDWENNQALKMFYRDQRERLLERKKEN